MSALRHGVSLVLAGLSAIVLVFNAMGQPSQRQGNKVFKTLIVELVYPFTVVEIEPPEKLVLDSVEVTSSFRQPQDAIRAHFIAMRALRYDQYLNTWDDTSIKLMRKRDADKRRGPEYWIDQWRAVGMGQHLMLLNRIEYGQYVLYQYQLELHGKPFRDTIALVQENNGWKLTQALASDPILMNWDNATGRIQVAAPSLTQKQQAK